MNNHTIMAVTALTAIAIITFLALWRGSIRISDIGSSSAVTGTAAPPSTLPPAGLSHLNEMLPGRGNLSEQATQTPVPEVPLRAAPEPAPSMEVPTTPVPGSSIKEQDAVGTPPSEATAISEKPSPPASPKAGSASASISPPAAVSESANDKVARVQLAARMQGLEPGPPIDLPVRLSQGQSRTIYFFTELRGLSGRSVLHRWERNGRIMQERQLHPASQSWRAYTAMTITGDMRGSWHISAVDATTGRVLAERRFEVE